MYTGWLHDPQNLTTGDYLFGSVCASWVPVQSLSLLTGHFVVYDVVTTGDNNFVADGILAGI
jgi:intein/homing endonuclease